MARYRGQKALYEVIENNRRRRPSDAVALHPESESDVNDLNSDEPVGIPIESRWRRPRSVQFNAGRIEITASYLVVAVFGLILLLCLLGAYRLGLWVAANGELAVSSGEPREAASAASSSFGNLESEFVSESGLDIKKSAAEAVTEDVPRNSEDRRNAIGILSYHDRTQLIPVKEYFRSNGIETEIIRMGSGFILVTAERFRENPARSGSDGFALLQRIVALGADYHPPSGSRYLGFTPESFEGAHGVLIQ
jgi:hypothetical protein